MSKRKNVITKYCTGMLGGNRFNSFIVPCAIGDKDKGETMYSL